MCPAGFNQSLWESCLENALKSREWAESQIKSYPNYLTNPSFSDIGRKQISHLLNNPPEDIAKEEYDFLIMMARHGNEFKYITDKYRIDPHK